MGFGSPPQPLGFAVVRVDSAENLPAWLTDAARREVQDFFNPRYGGGREDRSILIVKIGSRVETFTDGGESEDNYFFRDWSWIEGALKAAYLQGIEDANYERDRDWIPGPEVWKD